MKTYIRLLSGENTEEVYKIISENVDIYGELEPSIFIHNTFYGIYGENDELCAFFSLATFNQMFECTIAYVYVKEQYRKMGIFKKMVHFILKNTSEYKVIAIGAKQGNKLANNIYSRMFTFAEYNEEMGGNFYIVKDRRKFNAVE